LTSKSKPLCPVATILTKYYQNDRNCFISRICIISHLTMSSSSVRFSGLMAQGTTLSILTLLWHSTNSPDSPSKMFTLEGNTQSYGRSICIWPHTLQHGERPEISVLAKTFQLPWRRAPEKSMYCSFSLLFFWGRCW
jgi:hypothetical protein